MEKAYRLSKSLHGLETAQTAGKDRLIDENLSELKWMFSTKPYAIVIATHGNFQHDGEAELANAVKAFMGILNQRKHHKHDERYSIRILSP